MRRVVISGALPTLLTLCFAGLASAEEESAKVLAIDKATPKLEVSTSQIGFRDTLLFYTLHDQQAVVRLQIGNGGATFPITGTVHHE